MLDPERIVARRLPMVGFAAFALRSVHERLTAMLNYLAEFLRRQHPLPVPAVIPRQPVI